MQDYSLDQVELGQRLAAMKARVEADAARREQERRADRKAGRLSERVRNALRACTVPQLLKAKKLCDKFISDQRHAPSDADCDEDHGFIVQVLLSVPCRNQSYRYEITRSSKKAQKVCVNGPYWFRYWRDGKVVFRKQVKKKDDPPLLPRNVKTQLREYLASHDPTEVLEQARVKYARGAQDGR